MSVPTCCFAIRGVNENDLSGISVSGIDDVNGDMLDDIVIGAVLSDPNDRVRAGTSYVIFGSDLIFQGGFEQ